MFQTRFEWLAGIASGAYSVCAGNYGNYDRNNSGLVVHHMRGACGRGALRACSHNDHPPIVIPINKLL